MKITSIDVITMPIEGSGERPIICRINTDEGIFGYGEAGVAIGRGSPAAFAMIKDLAPLVLGMDPRHNEVIWEKLYKQSFWAQGNGAIMMAAISAIDTAIWDIKAKAADLPLYALLGGKHRDKLWAYASQIQFGWDMGNASSPGQSPSGDPAFYRDSAMRAINQGYNAIKTNFIRNDRQGKGLRSQDVTGHLSKEMMNLARERLEATREAVGPNVEIILENHAMTDASSAIQFAKMAREFDIMFFEEPCTPLNANVMRKIADNTDIPLATGERTFTRWGFLPFLENQSLSVIQPDIGNCGGITECKKICDMAHVYDVGVQTHVCSSPISVAVSLHLEAAIPNFVIHEHHVTNTRPGNIALCKYNYQPVDGYIEIPEIPGIGQELSDFALSKATIETISL
ncbi:MAG: mandelate racemase/muconate lactonizing enzyme family protein [Eubacteriaceae bacterium]|nr:mandelate racemase/muconate lactonizing enzyme family protein [Eubacteriaceae bacterium]